MAALLLGLAPLDARIVERWYSAGVYPWVQFTLTPLSNLVPIAVLDVLIPGAMVVCAIAGVTALRATRRRRHVRPLLQALWRLTVAASAAYVVFLLLWGLNYRRVPMAERLVLAPGPPSSEAVVGLGLRAASELNRLYAEQSSESAALPPSQNSQLRGAFDEVQRTLSDGRTAVPGRLKHSVLGPYFRWASVDGMINPFGLEVLANPDLLPFEEPFVAAHEWAHLAGFADESEASYVGWLTCLRADPASQYSAWMTIYWQVSGEVDVADRTELQEALEAGPRRDLNAAVTRVRSGQRPWLRDIGWRLYDRYLKANRVEQGVRSYGAVVTLILQAETDASGNPVRRVMP